MHTYINIILYWCCCESLQIPTTIHVYFDEVVCAHMCAVYLLQLDVSFPSLQISQNFRLCTKQQSLRLVHALFTRPDELVKIKFTDRK